MVIMLNGHKFGPFFSPSASLSRYIVLEKKVLEVLLQRGRMCQTWNPQLTPNHRNSVWPPANL